MMKLKQIADYLESRHGFQIGTASHSHAPLRERNVRPGLPQPFGGAPAYYLATSRDRAVWAEREGWALCFVELPETAALNPGRHKATVVLLRPVAPDGDELARVLVDLASALAIRIVIKNYGIAAAGGLAARGIGFRAYGRTEHYHQQAKWDDQTFPEVIYDLESLRLGHGSDGAFARPTVDEARAFIDRWSREYVVRNPEWDAYSVQSFYNGALDRLVNDSDYVCYAAPNGLPGGLVVADRVSDSQVDVWVCAAASGDVPVSPNTWSRALYLRFFAQCAADGVRFVNLGGSETASLHWFKSRLLGEMRPLLLERTHLVLEPAL
ncbi:MAG: hypothetical protein HKN20_11225 [Gemmatimonadetes bacterium]|nr:hypothetical protein [Gemmatimonadota bacterium]